jgi:hypothetical protein
VIALDAGVRLEGVPALHFWESVLNVMNVKRAKGLPCSLKPSSRTAQAGATAAELSHWHLGQDPDFIQMIQVLTSVDYVPLPLPPSSGLGNLLVLEDNEAVIKMCCKGRSAQMRHVVRTQRIDIDWLFERIRDDPGVFMKYVRTAQQMADLLTKASFTSIQWKALCTLCSLGPKYDSSTEQSGARPPKGRPQPKTKSVSPKAAAAPAPTPTIHLIQERKRPHSAIDNQGSTSPTEYYNISDNIIDKLEQWYDDNIADEQE